MLTCPSHTRSQRLEKQADERRNLLIKVADVLKRPMAIKIELRGCAMVCMHDRTLTAKERLVGEVSCDHRSGSAETSITIAIRFHEIECKGYVQMIRVVKKRSSQKHAKEFGNRLLQKVTDK